MRTRAASPSQDQQTRRPTHRALVIREGRPNFRRDGAEGGERLTDANHRSQALADFARRAATPGTPMKRCTFATDNGGKSIRRTLMARTSPRQRKTTGRVMHEFKHDELKSGRGGRGGKVKSRRQAIAIALKEAGASKYESASENRRNLRKSKRKEATGRTYQQEREGKSHVGARGRRASSRA